MDSACRSQGLRLNGKTLDRYEEDDVIPITRARLLSQGVVTGMLLLGTSSQLLADSDGYFCVGPTYLAYQFSFSDSIPGHNLFIIDLSDLRSQSTPQVVPLPDFQVHGMMCSDSIVQVLGWNSLYRITVRSRDPAVVDSMSVTPPGSIPDAFERQGANLGSLRPISDRYALATNPLPNAYELRFGIDPPDGGESVGTTDLVRLDDNGEILWSYRLYRGWIRE